MAMLSRGRQRRRESELGSGTAIGVAIIFPILMLVIVSLQALSDSTRIEQGIQSSANRAARAASLCCYYTGGSAGAETVAQASLRAAASAGAYNRINCSNDVVADSRVVFINVGGQAVSTGPGSDGNYRAVPPGGTVHVFVTCRLPPQVLGGFGLPGLNVTRTTVGVATIDPYRFRGGA